MTNIDSKFIKKLKGPLLIIGAGGFVGYNFLLTFLKARSDVYGLDNNKKSWRLKNFKQSNRLIFCDITKKDKLEKVLRELRPQTIINCSAYGGAHYQEDVEKIYKVNFLSTLQLLQILSKHKFEIYMQCGSSSEYGLNCTKPAESSQLLPDSHYAVSKMATSGLISFYGKKVGIPVVHLRLYSVYGPWEEPNRLMPQIIINGLKGKLPDFVNGDISRDFIYVDDVIRACVKIANNFKEKHWGEVYNIGTGVKTTIRELSELSAKLYHIDKIINFGTLKARKWDLTDWYANVKKIEKDFKWKYKIDVKTGLILFTKWKKIKNNF